MIGEASQSVSDSRSQWLNSPSWRALMSAARRLIRSRRLVSFEHALDAQGGELGDRGRGVAEHAQAAVRHAGVVHRPFRQADVAEADLDQLAVRRVERLDRALGALDAVGRLLPVAGVEREDQVGLAKHAAVHAHGERMAVGEVEPAVGVVDGGAARLGERDEVVKTVRRAAGVLGEQHREARGEQLVGDLGERGAVGGHRHRHGGVAPVGQGDVGGERLLLQPGVVAHVDRALRLRHHRAVGAGERIRHALDAARLVVPFRVVADLLALHVGGVDPVDERPPPALVHRPGGADDEDRRAVDVGVVDAHGGVQHADDVVHDGDHRLAGRLGVAVRDLHRDLLVLAQQHRRLVAAVVDQRVVQPAVARAGVERDVGEAELLDQVDDDVGLPLAGGEGAFAPAVSSLARSSWFFRFLRTRLAHVLNSHC